MINSRAKGQRGERQIRDLLGQLLDMELRRGDQRNGAREADLESTDKDKPLPFAVEVKVGKMPNPRSALSQLALDCIRRNDSRPQLVVIREDGKNQNDLPRVWIAMPWESFERMVKK